MQAAGRAGWRAARSGWAARSGRRGYKNFGHAREHVPRMTTYWHGFLTFTFVGCLIEWRKMWGIITGKDDWNVPREPRPEPDL